jgi:large subunit ribosomal protein L5
MAKEKSKKTAAPAAAEGAPKKQRNSTPGYKSRLQKQYQDDALPKLKKEFGIDNIMAVPRIEKVVLNIGLGEAIQNIKFLDDAADELAQLSGQKPTMTRARKSIANFKLREGMPIGACGTSWTA